MAEKDLATKKIEDYNEVFADIYNTLLFRNHILKPSRLRAGATESIYKTDTGDLNSQHRDILKKYQDEANLVISALGIENQASLDRTMPIRVMGYDAGTYRQQLTHREKKITPVITIVLNMTDEKWNTPKSIHEMLNMDTALAEYVQNYKIYVFDIAFLEDKIIDAFTSDFREIARFFKRKRLGKNPLTSKNQLDHPREIMEFISAFTRDGRYLDGAQYLEEMKKEGGAVTMCEVAEALITEGRQKGRLEGKIELLCEMNFTVAEIARRLNISQEQVENIMQQN